MEAVFLSQGVYHGCFVCAVHRWRGDGSGTVCIVLLFSGLGPCKYKYLYTVAPWVGTHCIEAAKVVAGKKESKCITMKQLKTTSQKLQFTYLHI